MKYKKKDKKHVAHSKEAHATTIMMTTTTAPKSLFGDPVTIALILIVLALLAYIGYTAMNPQQPSNGKVIINASTNQTPAKPAKTTVELFVMSECPYGVQAEAEVKKVLDEFGGDVNLSLHFIASETSPGTFSSLHGDTEVAEDLRQVCIMKHYPQNLVSYLSCITPSYPNFGNAWENCTTQNNMDVNLIRTCSTGSEGASLLSDNIKRTDSLNIQSSPTIYLNGTLYNGAASAGSLAPAICAIIPESNTCKNLPPEVAVGLTVVNDKNCVVCDSSQIVGALRSQFQMNNLTETDVDYSSSEGQALLQEFNITGVPAYILNASVANHSSYGSLSQYLHQVGSSYVLLVQPSELVNVVRTNNSIELFVMSWCPYGNEAEQAMNELLGAIPDLKFTGLYFIASEGANGTFTSLHGDGEVQEDLRQVCIIKYYNNSKLFNYLMCIDKNSPNSGAIWQSCATNSSIDVAKIGNCSTGSEGKALLADNIKLSNSLSIQSSPTLLFDNSTIFSSISAEQMRQVVCGYSPALAGCNKTLSGQTSSGQVNAPSGGCGT